MRRLLALLAVVFPLGLAGAVALGSGESTNEVVACATVTSPAHTVAVDGSDVRSIPGEVASSCVTSTFTVPTVTVTSTLPVTSTSTSTTTTTPVPAGKVISRKTFETGGITSIEEPCPSWPAPFGENYCNWYEISQYGFAGCATVSTAEALAGTHSGRMEVRFNGTGQRTRCQIGLERRTDPFTNDYYHEAWKLPTTWSETDPDNGMTVSSHNYQSIDSCNGSVLPTAVDDLNDSEYIVLHSGFCPYDGVAGATYYSGNPAGWPKRPAGIPGPLYLIPPGKVQRGVWMETIMHVYWSPNTDGVLEGWYRVAGGAWVKTLSMSRSPDPAAVQSFTYSFPTLQTGVDHWGTNVTADTLKNSPDSIHATEDKIGMDGLLPAGFGYFDQWCRATTFAVAAGC